MFKAESGSLRFSSATATDAASGQQSADRTNGRGTALGDIGFVGLGRMGTAMAKNLAAAGRQVIACVRRPEQMGTLLALGLKPTTNLADLFDCEVVISMLPDDEAVREVALGRQGRKGLAAGLRAGAIHLSMSTISTAAASQLASAHARCHPDPECQVPGELAVRFNKVPKAHARLGRGSCRGRRGLGRDGARPTPPLRSRRQRPRESLSFPVAATKTHRPGEAQSGRASSHR